MSKWLTDIHKISITSRVSGIVILVHHCIVPLSLEEQSGSSSLRQVTPSAPPMESSIDDEVNPPPWEPQVLQWLKDVVSRQQQKQVINTSQHQYDLSLVAKMTSFCSQLSMDIPGLSSHTHCFIHSWLQSH